MHLNETELIDYLEGTLPSRRAAHLASCERCRLEADGVAAALRDARGADVPEPAPLFWDHFTARVRDAIGAEAPARSAEWFRWPRLAFAGAAIVAALVVAGVWWSGLRAPVDRGPVARQEPAAAIEATLDADPEWSFVASMTDGIGWEEAQAAGLGVRPGAAERAALQLSRGELTELARLLREEMADDEGSL